MIYSVFIIVQRYMHITRLFFSNFISSPAQLPTRISKVEDLASTIFLLLDRREESEDARHVHARHRSHGPATVAVSAWDRKRTSGPDEFSAVVKDAHLLGVSAPKLRRLVWGNHGE